MHNRYIINESVEFHPATSTLRDIHSPDVIFALNSPAGRCLLLLINRAGAVVTQQEFMEIVWNQSGMAVTASAYYQNISVLRKGLKRVGLGDDIIVTLPRVGLTLASGIRIRKLTTRPVVEVCNDITHGPDLAREERDRSVNGTTANETTANETTENETTENEITANEITANEISPMVTHTRSLVLQRCLYFCKIDLKAQLRYGGIFLAIIALCVFLLFFGVLNDKSDYFSNYTSVMSVNQCEILLPPYLNENSDKESAIRYGERFIGDCQKYPWIYVTKISNVPRISVIRCNKSFSQSTSCISAYFIE